MADATGAASDTERNEYMANLLVATVAQGVGASELEYPGGDHGQKVQRMLFNLVGAETGPVVNRPALDVLDEAYTAERLRLW